MKLHDAEEGIHGAAYIPDGKVDEDPDKMDDAADQTLQLADDGAGVLERQRKVLAVLVDFQHCLAHVMQRDLAITINVKRLKAELGRIWGQKMLNVLLKNEVPAACMQHVMQAI